MMCVTVVTRRSQRCDTKDPSMKAVTFPPESSEEGSSLVNVAVLSKNQSLATIEGSDKRGACASTDVGGISGSRKRTTEQKLTGRMTVLQTPTQ